MPRGPKASAAPPDMIGNAVHVMRIATGEIEDTRRLPRTEGRLEGRQSPRRDPIRVVAKVRFSKSETGPTSPGHPVFQDRRLGNIVPSFSCSPWILVGARQSGFSKPILRIRFAHLFINLWSATETTGFPSPECGEAHARDH